MKKLFTLLVLGTCCLAAPSYAATAETPPAAPVTPTAAAPATSAPTPIANGIMIENAYSFATSTLQKNGAAFMTIRNISPAPDRLIAATTDAAATVEFHETMMEEGAMIMAKQPGIEIPASNNVMLEPTGSHIMLMGLKTPFKEGEKFKISLRFEKAGMIETEVLIQPPGEPLKQQDIAPLYTPPVTPAKRVKLEELPPGTEIENDSENQVPPVTPQP